MRRYLVVANQTLGGAALGAKVREAMAAGECSFHIVVPATRPRDHLTWTEGEAIAVARERLEAALAWFKRMGAPATGDVGDANPMFAINDALLSQRFDEIIISTLPPGLSRWLKRDLPARVERRSGLPVTHVVGEAVAVRRTA
jgi:hypothetical protein